MAVKSKMAKKRSASGKRQGRRRLEVARLPGWGLPPHLGVTLRVSSAWNINHAGALQTFGVSCNNPYQPFITATTSEVPAYLSYLSTAYDNLYTVRSRIRVEMINSTVGDSLTTVLAYDGNTSGTLNVNNLCESRDAKALTIGYYTGGSNKSVLTGEFTPERYLSIPPSSVNNICVGGAPPDPYYWIVGLQSIAGGTGNVGTRIVVEYDVVFTQLAQPPP